MFEHICRNEQDLQNGDDVLVMKEICACQNINRIIVSNKKEDQGVNKAVLASKSLSNKANITGRNIWDNGKAVERNGRKALALLEHSEHKQCCEDGKTPSGTVCEDFCLWTRQAMCKELKGEKNDTKEEEEEENGDNSVDSDEPKDDMPSSHFFPGHLAFVLWGPIMPPGQDEDCKCHVFFTTEQSKEKKKDGRKAVRNEQAEEDNFTRSSAAASEGRGLANKEHLFAASVAQQSSFQAMFESSRNKESRVFFLSERVKQAEADIALWMPRCSSAMSENPDQHKGNFAFQKLMSALEKKQLLEDELDKAMSFAGKEHNAHQAFVDSALDAHMMAPPSKKKHKVASEASARSANSFAVTSVNIPVLQQVEQEGHLLPEVAAAARAAAAAPVMPDGQRMCITTSQCDRIARSAHSNSTDANSSDSP